MDKPAVDSIEGIPPAIAIEQRNTVRTTRSTVGTMTEICDYLKALWPHVAQLHCRGCGQPVRKDAPQLVWKSVRDDGANPAGRGQTSKDSADRTRQREVLVTFDLPLSEKLSLAESFALIAKQGFQRLLWGNAVVRLEDALARLAPPAPRPSSLTVVQDRLTLTPSARARFIEACEQAYHFGQGKLVVWEFQPPAAVRHPRPFSNHLHCAACDLAYREPLPALFSFNHPVGACATCKGFGRVISIDYDLAMPDRTKSLAEGVVKPWQTGTAGNVSVICCACAGRWPFPPTCPSTNSVPMAGVGGIASDYGKDEEHEWPRCWYGVKGYFRWLESKAYKMHMRVLLSRYRAYTTCPDCRGARLKPEALLYLLPAGVGGRSRDSSSAGDSAVEAGAQQLSLADFYALTITDALQVVETLARKRAFRPGDPLTLVLDEVRSRLAYLEEVGVAYLTLDRPTRPFRGETERVA